MNEMMFLNQTMQGCLECRGSGCRVRGAAAFANGLDSLPPNVIPFGALVEAHSSPLVLLRRNEREWQKHARAHVHIFRVKRVGAVKVSHRNVTGMGRSFDCVDGQRRKERADGRDPVPDVCPHI